MTIGLRGRSARSRIEHDRFAISRSCREKGETGNGRVPIQLAVGHGDGHSGRGHPVGAVDGRFGPERSSSRFCETVHRMRWPLFTIAVMLAIAYTTRYQRHRRHARAGLHAHRVPLSVLRRDARLARRRPDRFDTSSNALFGSLQKITAEGLVKRGVLNLPTEQASILMAAANSTGGVMGKMIDAQSIVVSAAATQQPGREGEILRFVFWHSLALAALMGVLIMVQAYRLPWMIPK